MSGYLQNCYRLQHPNSSTFSRYYEHAKYGEGATRIDRQYHWGNVEIVDSRYVGVAFSDHHAFIVKIKLPEVRAKIICPKSRPQFKAKPEVVKDPIFNSA